MNYSLLINYKHPKPRVIKTKKEQYLHVYNVLSQKFHEGLIIAESDTISDPVVENLCSNENWTKNDIDIMICKSFSSVTEAEISRANLYRISADPDFDMMSLMQFEQQLKEKLYTLMICQNFVNENYNNVKEYIDQRSREYEQAGMKEFIDYTELNRQLAYFVYFDIDKNKIIGIDHPTMVEYLTRVKDLIQIPQEHIEPLAQLITI